MHPVDTLRAKLDMLVVPKGNKTAGPFGMFFQEARKTIAAQGWRGLYGGYAVAVLGSMPANALYFGGYHFWRRQLGREGHGVTTQKLEWWRDILAGFGAQVFANVYWTPLDVVKQRLQVAPVGTDVRVVLRSIVSQHGVWGFWHGYCAGLWVWGPYSGLYFGSYELMKEASAGYFGTGREEGSIAQSLLCGMAGSMVAAVATQPLDCVKTRIQVLGGERSSLRVLRGIVEKEGTRALFRGTGARVMWLAPGGGITLCVFEATVGRFDPPL